MSSKPICLTIFGSALLLYSANVSLPDDLVGFAIRAVIFLIAIVVAIAGITHRS